MSWPVDAYINGLALGGFVAFTRGIYFAGRYPTWGQWIGAVFLCVIASIFAMLGLSAYFGEDWIAGHPSGTILAGGVAAFAGPELPELVRVGIRVGVRGALDHFARAWLAHKEDDDGR